MGASCNCYKSDRMEDKEMRMGNIISKSSSSQFIVDMKVSKNFGTLIV